MTPEIILLTDLMILQKWGLAFLKPLNGICGCGITNYTWYWWSCYKLHLVLVVLLQTTPGTGSLVTNYTWYLFLSILAIVGLTSVFMCNTASWQYGQGQTMATILVDIGHRLGADGMWHVTMAVLTLCVFPVLCWDSLQCYCYSCWGRRQLIYVKVSGALVVENYTVLWGAIFLTTVVQGRGHLLDGLVVRFFYLWPLVWYCLPQPFPLT